MSLRRVVHAAIVAVCAAAPLASAADGAPFEAFDSLCTDSLWYPVGDLRGCGPDVFLSQISLTTGLPIEDDDPNDSIASLLTNALAGNTTARAFLETHFTGGAVVPLVPLRADPCDAYPSNGSAECAMPYPGSNPVWSPGDELTASEVLSDEQEALLGCGPFWQTLCEFDGINARPTHAELAVLVQAWPGTAGDYGESVTWRRPDGCPLGPLPPPYHQPCRWTYPDLRSYCIGCLDPGGALFPIPGTLDFDGPLPALRFYEEGTVQLPGARGPSSPEWVLEQDGSTDGLAIPVWDDPLHGVTNGFGLATGLAFRSELAALSWNMAMTLVALSRASDPEAPELDELDPADPARVGGCSFRQPQFCRAFAYPVPESGAGSAAAVALGLVAALARRRHRRRKRIARTGDTSQTPVRVA